MPRPKTQSDERILEVALSAMHELGPHALTFSALSKRCGLSAATLVQRFGNKENLKKGSLLLARDRRDTRTAHLAGSVPRTPDGAIELLIGLTREYGEVETFAKGLLVLREDLRDPVLRARGAAWKADLCKALEACFAQTSGCPAGIGLLAATHWQGYLLWWSFDPQRKVEDYVEESLRVFLAKVCGPPSGGGL